MSNMRITGMYSGFDTDQMIKDLMKVESTRVDEVKKDKQLVEWEQDAYRDIIGSVQDLMDKYFNTLDRSNNLLSASSFAKFSYSIKSGGVDSTAVSVAATSEILSYEHTINSIDQLATKDTWSSASTFSMRGIETDGFVLADVNTQLASTDFEFTLSVNGVAKNIKIDQGNNYGSMGDFVDALNAEIQAEFGYQATTNIVSTDGTELEFDLAGSEVKIMEYAPSGLSYLNLNVTTDPAVKTVSSYDYKSKTIGELFNLTDLDLDAITINGKSSFDIEATDSIEDLMKEINDSDANVKLSYNSLKDAFELTSIDEGSANNIDVDLTVGSDTEKLFTALGLSVADRTQGQNAELTIDNVSIVQGSNNFSLDGVLYTLNETTATAVDVKVTQNNDSIIEVIEGFVNEYNDLVKEVHGKLQEKRYYDYEPLTDDEREALSDDEVEKWDEKAKSGVLRSSSELTTMMSKLRAALYESVEGVNISLKDIGIDTSANYKENGKLTLDKTVLKSALEENYDKVVSLFTSESDKDYLDQDSVSERYSENGLAHRFEDIMKDYVRTSRDSSGKKGILVEKAGLLGDASVLNNILSESVLNFDERISKLLIDLADKEAHYYGVFGRMESALAQLQNQSNSLMSQLGG